MIALIGLGNPGTKYKNNRHNVGYLFIDQFLNDRDNAINEKKFNGELSSFLIKWEKDLTDLWNTGLFNLIILFKFVFTESWTSESENLPNSILYNLTHRWYAENNLGFFQFGYIGTTSIE